MKRGLPFAGVLTAACLTLVSVAGGPARATTPPTFTVNSIFDAPADFTNNPNYDICRTNVTNTTCTLRAAIMNANHYVGGGVNILIPPGTYTLSIAPAPPYDERTGVEVNVAVIIQALNNALNGCS